MKGALVAVLLFASFLPGVLGQERKPALAGDTPETIVCGPLTMEIHVSRTAHLFHVVDQLSGWSEFCHAQYRRAVDLDPADKEALALHARIRSKRGWSRGLEQAFYSPLPLEEALRAGVKAGHLTDDEAATEKAVFARFEKRVDALLQAQETDLRKSLASLDREAVTRMAKSLSKLCGANAVTVPVYLMASPPPGGGGGLSGGRLTLELCPGEDPAPTLVHEVVHAFLEKKKPDLAKCASGTPGLDAETLNEGIAYAVMPGLFSAGKEDRLARTVARDLAAGRGMDDSYVRFNRYGLALRPVVKEALESGNLESLLARAQTTWVTLQDEEAARAGPRIRSAGPAWEELRQRMKVLRPGVNPWSFNHSLEDYDKFVSGLRKGDLFVMLLAADHKDRAVPLEYRDLLPVPEDEIWKEIAEGRIVEKEGAARGFRVVLLAAPTTARLRALVKETALLAK